MSLNDNYEDTISSCQELTFDTLKEAVTKLDREKKAQFGEEQKAQFGLINADGKYTNLALLLSDQCPYTIKAARFEKITENAKFQYEYGGSVLKQFNETHRYISKVCNSTFWDESSDVIAPYPGKSLEALLLNAIIHRNYNIPDSIIVKCFLNCIEVISPGGVPNGCTLDDAMQGISLKRNPKLAAIFKEIGLVELLGCGLQHVRRPYAIKPQLKSTENVFYVKMFDNVIYGSKELSERDTKIIEFLLDKQIITRSVAAELLGVELQTAGRCLKNLVESKIIKPIDKGKDTKYILRNYKVEKEETPRNCFITKPNR